MQGAAPDDPEKSCVARGTRAAYNRFPERANAPPSGRRGRESSSLNARVLQWLHPFRIAPFLRTARPPASRKRSAPSGAGRSGSCARRKGARRFPSRSVKAPPGAAACASACAPAARWSFSSRHGPVRKTSGPLCSNAPGGSPDMWPRHRRARHFPRPAMRRGKTTPTSGGCSRWTFLPIRPRPFAEIAAGQVGRQYALRPGVLSCACPRPRRKR